MFEFSNKMLITVAIAEDNSFALKACLDKLNQYAAYKVVLKAFNGKELTENFAQHNIDVILMDIQMPNMDGIEATKIISKLNPKIKIIMLTTFDDDENIFKAIMAGASGYLLKEESAEILHRSIIETLTGGAPMSAGIAMRVLNLLRNPPAFGSFVKDEDFGLTKREIELLNHLKKGLSYEQIAANLFISYGTVRKHIENIYRKLQVNNKINAVDMAVKHRLI